MKRKETTNIVMVTPRRIMLQPPRSIVKRHQGRAAIVQTVFAAFVKGSVSFQVVLILVVLAERGIASIGIAGAVKREIACTSEVLTVLWLNMMRQLLLMCG